MAILLTLACSAICLTKPARADDLIACSKSKAVNEAIAACTRVIKSGKLSGRPLARVYFFRMARWQAKGDQDRVLEDWSEVSKHDPTFIDKPLNFDIDKSGIVSANCPSNICDSGKNPGEQIDQQKEINQAIEKRKAAIRMQQDEVTKAAYEIQLERERAAKAAKEAAGEPRQQEKAAQQTAKDNAAAAEAAAQQETADKAKVESATPDRAGREQFLSH